MDPWEHASAAGGRSCPPHPRAGRRWGGAHLLVVLPDPQPHRLQLAHGFRAFPELPRRSSVFLASRRAPAARGARSRPARARPARRVRRRRHCLCFVVSLQLARRGGFEWHCACADAGTEQGGIMGNVGASTLKADAFKPCNYIFFINYRTVAATFFRLYF